MQSANRKSAYAREGPPGSGSQPTIILTHLTRP
jgi:hypothetical protein